MPSRCLRRRVRNGARNGSEAGGRRSGPTPSEPAVAPARHRRNTCSPHACFPPAAERKQLRAATPPTGRSSRRADSGGDGRRRRRSALAQEAAAASGANYCQHCPHLSLVAPRAACHFAAAPLRFGAAVAAAAASSSATPGLDSRFCEGRRPFVLTPPHPTPRANPHPTPAPGDRFGLGAGCGSGRTATRRSCRGRPARQCEPAVAPSCRHR